MHHASTLRWCGLGKCFHNRQVLYAAFLFPGPPHIHPSQPAFTLFHVPAATLFWLPAATLSFVASSVVGSGGGQWPLPLSSSPLGDLALLLLLVLVHNPDSPPSSINSFRWVNGSKGTCR